MATSTKEDESSGGNWWDSWVQAAKETSAQALEFVRRDLGEFTCTVQADTEHAVVSTTKTVKETLKAENTNVAKNRMKEGINSLFHGITKALTIPPDDDGEKPVMVVASESAVYDRSKVRLHAIQVDPGTYVNEPEGPTEHYVEWCKHFDIESRKGDVSELLVSKVEVRALYTKLVPAQVSHAEFWQRYFYKLHQVALDEARKQALIKRAERSRTDNNSINDDWSGDEDMEIVELPSVSPKKEKSPVRDTTNKSTEKAEKSPEKVVSSSVSSKTSPAKNNTSTVGPETTQNVEQSVVPDIPEPSIESRVHENTDKTSPENDKEPKLSEKSLPVEKVPEITVDSVKDGKINPPSIQSAGKEKQSITDSVKQTVAESVKDKEETQIGEKAIKSEKLPDTSQQKDNDEPKVTENESRNVEAEVETKQKAGGILKEKETPVLEQETKNEQSSESESSNAEPKVEEKSEPVKPSVCKLDIGSEEELRTKEKGDMIVVGSDRGTPTSDSSGNKDLSNEDDWDKDFDLDVTEEDLKAAEELAKKMGDNLDLEDDDWENWE